MTAVARLSVNNHPLIVGDLLISGQENDRRAREIPTAEDLLEIFPKGSGFIPLDLSQKISIIRNMVIGWAGSRISARIVLTELFEMGKRKLFSLDSLKKYFDNLDKSIKAQGIEFCGFINCSNGISFFRAGLNKPIKTKLFGEVDILGTGSERIQDFLTQFSTAPATLSNLKNATKADLAYSFGLLLSGCFLNIELATRQSLYEYYGGGYEVVTFKNGMFQKLNDVTYLFWSARVTNDKVLISSCPHDTFKYTYFNDVLAICSATFDELPNGEYKISRARKIDIVPPMYRRITKDEVSNFYIPSMNSKWLCNCYFVTTLDNLVEIMVQVDYRDKNEVLIRFDEQGDKLMFSIHGSYLERVGNEFARRFLIRGN